MAIPVKGYVPQENSSRPTQNRTSVPANDQFPTSRIPTEPRDSQVIRHPLHVTPPVSVKHSRALGKVHLLRRERVLEVVLLTDVPSVAVETGTSELGRRLLENLDRILAALVPVVIECDDLGVPETVAVHHRPQRLSHVCLLRRGEYAGRVGRIAELRLVLYPDCESGDSLVPEPLQRL